LKDWLKNGWLIEHRTSPQEIQDLLSVADRDLADSRVSGLSPDGRLSIAYNAALQSAHAALAACGYRSARDAHHYRVIQSLVYTIESDELLIIQFDKFRKKRNIGGYERAGMISLREAEEMFSLASKIRSDVGQWLQQHHPRLLKK
jgi:hypothetical protein